MRVTGQFVIRYLHRRSRKRTRQLWVRQQHDWPMPILWCRGTEQYRYVLLQFKGRAKMRWCSITDDYRFHDFFDRIPYCNINIIGVRISYCAARQLKERVIGRCDCWYCRGLSRRSCTSHRIDCSSCALCASQKWKPKWKRLQPTIPSKARPTRDGL